MVGYMGLAVGSECGRVGYRTTVIVKYMDNKNMTATKHKLVSLYNYMKQLPE
jgi:hypothetical protein